MTSDGWKLVPVEPTQSMNNAGLSAVNQHGKRFVWETYRAMLAAAPAAPQAEPVATVRIHRTGGNAGIAWSAVPTGAQMMLDGDLLYAAPQQADEREPCIGSDPACPCQDGDPCHYRDTATTKAWPIPQAEPVSDPRPCTCHPDDNPPVPCARKYALSECRAASGEPTEAQIEKERSNG